MISAQVASRGGVIAPEELAPHLPAPPAKLRGSEAAAAVAVRVAWVHYWLQRPRCFRGGRESVGGCV